MTIVSFPQPPQMQRAGRARYDLLDSLPVRRRQRLSARMIVCGRVLCLVSGAAGSVDEGSRALCFHFLTRDARFQLEQSNCRSLSFSLRLPYFAMRC